MPSPEAAALPPAPLAAEEARALLELARAAIDHGLRSGAPPRVDAARYPARLREPGAAFVTLRSPDGALRGCTGELEAVRPLAESVSHHAFAAAFRDPRFRPLTAAERDGLELHVSVLSAPIPLDVHSERELVDALRPGIDGLILEDGPHRATFLPAVWDSIPDPRDFVQELQHKAGLPPHHWTPSTRAWRYEVRDVG
ncbi:MAG: AmmeMemoRadiSam system protein A [Myxococcota bacterium]|nr:AmmeMemoRadiSam system protein A [Myxococcota bacterium]